MQHITVPGSVGSPRPSRERSAGEIVALVADELGDVERLFRENLASPTRIVEQIGAYVARGGGKRIRPTLHLLCARLCGYRGPHAVLLGTVVEFIHCATLIHDDIIDEAKTRRGRPTVHRRWGNDVTVLFGDYMFAKAMELALQAGSLEVMRRLAATTLEMTEGEMLQTRYVGRLDVSLDDYMDLVAKKTAALFGCSCELAGLVSSVSEPRCAALGLYGRHLGIAFQIVDDLLDVTGDPETLGKPAASDLRAGKATLAVLELLREDPPRARELAELAMGDRTGEADAAIRELTRMLHDHGAIERTAALARDHARRAALALESFEDGPLRRALASLPERLLERAC